MRSYGEDRLETIRAERKAFRQHEERVFMFIVAVMTCVAMSVVALALALAYWIATR